MDRSVKKAITGIIAVTLLILAELILAYIARYLPVAVPVPIKIALEKNRVTFLAFGDINLGRTVGQKILKGDINYPFQKIDLTLDSSDIIFANLESQLSDQNGETVSRKSNIVFVGPPEGAVSLRNAGFDILSTANNHAMDYGIKAARETIDLLNAENILSVGTSKTPRKVFQPLIFEKNKIKFAIFAVTSFMNFNPKRWQEIVAHADTAKLRNEIQRIRDSVDVIILSYHGGVEYSNRSADHVRKFADWCAAHGVDLFIGHHPHVPFGIYKRSNVILIHSLGNFIFFQPQAYWTQRSYGVKFWFEKENASVRYGIEKIVPIKVGLQTERLNDTAEIKKLKIRTQQLSNFDLTTYWK